MIESDLTFLSLFTGIGGLDLGFERGGWKCVAQVEFDPFCRQILSQHWPHVPRYTDVRKFCLRLGDCLPENEDGEARNTAFADCDCIRTAMFTDTCGHPLCIIGGDPCQENSNARRSAETLSPSLGGEFIRIVDQLRPQFVLRENPATVRKDAPWPWWRFRSELERLDYAVIAFRLRACCVGADFRRDRLFLLGELQSTQRSRLEGNEREELATQIKRRHHADATRSNRWTATPRVYRRTDRLPRRMDRTKSLGNAVVPEVGEYIARLMAQAIKGNQ